MLAMFVVGLMAAQAAAPPPSAEAEQLGLRLARRGMLASMLPMMVAKETEDMIAAHPGLSPAEKTRLRAASAAQAHAGGEALFAAIGYSYAQTLSVEDMKAVIAFQESPVAARYKAAEPKAIVATMQAMQGFGFKKETWRRFCTGSPAPKPKDCE